MIDHPDPAETFRMRLRALLDEFYAAGSDEERQAIAARILAHRQTAPEAPPPLTGTTADLADLLKNAARPH
ncbi:hypothetical protein [Qipengyuania sp.]|uniref:hypothetical protein n=1 Tax=Qipengyuania sp. TaxID=2004515 RepID=UPI0035C833B7